LYRLFWRSAIAFSAFYTIDLAAVLLAASFNASRYIGIALQAASIFFVFRGGNDRRLLALPVSMMFSFSGYRIRSYRLQFHRA